MAEKSREYSSSIGMTQQFRFCPNPFRVDLYKGCDFGCLYCFANSSVAKGHDGFGEAKISKLERLFSKALDSNEESGNLTIELLRHRVPLHCGGMADPFQTREWTMHLTKQFIELTNKYNYPVTFSTKVADLPDEYFELLNPEIHAFQVSILGWDDDFVRKYETNTPTAAERVEFVKKLRAKGFWCSVRIQPLVNLEQAIKLLEHCGDAPSYITVEHLKIPFDNTEVRMLFKDEFVDGKFTKSKNNFRNMEAPIHVKKENIAKVKELVAKYNIPVGVGDNDLHYLSDSRCCCGIDTINENFENYLKYNLTYFTTGEYDLDSIWTPCSNCRECFYSRAFGEVGPEDRFKDFKECTNEYIYKYQYCLDEVTKAKLNKQLFGTHNKKLF